MHTPRLLLLPATTLVGLNRPMSLARNETAGLGRSFMPRRTTIANQIGTDLFSVQQYPADYFDGFEPATQFVKWAAVAVSVPNEVPPGMAVLLLPAGLYAVFDYRGLPSEGAQMFRYIFQTWLPASDYLLDDRPHFERLGPAYDPQSPDSEEEIWVPVRPR